MPSFQLEDGPVIEWKDSNYIIVGSKKETGFLSSGGWKVKYKKGSGNSTHNMNVSKNSSGGTALGGYKIHKM